MANVTFRRGTEANLPSSGMADEGCFFLAEDTGNLYVGDENGNLVPINRSPYYGTCPTEASTNSKVVTIDINSDVFSLSEGTMISVRFANANTAASPTLNVNGSGAIAVKSYGTTSIGDTEDSSWHAGEVVTFIYDGTYWMFVGGMGNIQPDWEQDTDTADDYIKNKPRIKAGEAPGSTIEGYLNSKALGISSHAEGYYNAALGLASHVEGYGTNPSMVTLSGSGTTYTSRGNSVKVGDILTLRDNSTFYTTVLSVSGRTITVDTSLGDGNLVAVILDSYALGTGSHVEGNMNVANNNYEHAEGQYNVSNSGSTDAEKTISSIGIGSSNTARKNAVEVMKNGNIYVFGVGDYDGTNIASASTLQTVIGNSANVQSDWEEDDNTSPSYIQNKPSIKSGTGEYSIIEGDLESNDASGDCSHAEGLNTIASNVQSHAEGSDTTSSGDSSHAEGNGTTASGDSSHAEGNGTTASGNKSHAEGAGTDASGYESHSEGLSSVAYGNVSHAEGSKTVSYGSSSHAEGFGDYYSIRLTSTGQEDGKEYTCGRTTTSVLDVGNVVYYNSLCAIITSRRIESNICHIVLSSTFGELTNAQARVYHSVAIGFGSHIEGERTMALNEGEHAEGIYNKSHSGSTLAEKTISSIGIGDDNGDRANAFEVMKNGDVYVLGVGDYDGADISNASTLKDVIDGMQSDIQTISTTQSDWEEYDATSPSYIQHRPPIRAGIGGDSVEEGKLTSNYAIGKFSHAEGGNRVARGSESHAEGKGSTRTITISSDKGSELNYIWGPKETPPESGNIIIYEGLYASVTGVYRNYFTVSKTLGDLTQAVVTVVADGAFGDYSHVEGLGTIANNVAEHAEGRFNFSSANSDTISSIGIGKDDTRRQNAVEVLSDGEVYIHRIGGYDGTNIGVLGVKSIRQVINEIDSNIHSYTIESVSPDTGYLTAYQLQEDGVAKGAKINIPKDMVVSNGEVKTVTVADEPYVGAQVGDKYIDLTIANATTDHLYIPVKDLVDVYTEGNGIDISSGNVVSVVVDPNNANGLSVGASGVALAVATTSSAGAMSAADKTKLDGIEDGAGVVGTLNTNNSTAQTIESSESFGGSINLHKVSKTGSYEDLNLTPTYQAGENIDIRNAIPRGYTRIKSAVNAANTYIDTGIRPTTDDVEIEIRCVIRTNTSYIAFFADVAGSATADEYGLAVFATSYITLYLKGTSLNAGITYTNGHLYHIKGTMKNGFATLYVKDETSGTEGYNTINYTYHTPINTLKLYKNSYNSACMGASSNIYSAKLKIGGATVLNYLPTMRDNDNVVGFWDTVTNSFITPTAGSFTSSGAFDEGKEYIISSAPRITFDEILSKPIASKTLTWQPGSSVSVEAGWRRIGTLSYCNFILMIRGNYTNSRPTVVGVAISMYHQLINMKQLWGSIYSMGDLSKLRLVQHGTSIDTFDLEFYHGARTNIGYRQFTLIGYGSFTPSEDFSLVENQEVPSGTNNLLLNLRLMLDRPSIRTNLASTSVGYYDGTNIAPGVQGILGVANGGTGNSSVDTTPTASSTKMVTSGGIKTYVDTSIGNLDIPTATSDLTNDSGFITSSDIPVTDVTVGGTSVVSNGVAVVPSIPTIIFRQW